MVCTFKRGHYRTIYSSNSCTSHIHSTKNSQVKCCKWPSNYRLSVCHVSLTLGLGSLKVQDTIAASTNAQMLTVIAFKSQIPQSLDHTHSEWYIKSMVSIMLLADPNKTVPTLIFNLILAIMP